MLRLAYRIQGQRTGPQYIAIEVGPSNLNTLVTPKVNGCFFLVDFGIDEIDRGVKHRRTSAFQNYYQFESIQIKYP